MRRTPWVALLDPAVTTSVQEGFYVVYILGADGRRLLKLPRFRGVVLDLGDYGSVVTASIAAS